MPKKRKKSKDGESNATSGNGDRDEEQQQVLRYEKPGEYFGELALLRGDLGLRSATVKAETDVVVLTLKRSAFKRLFGGKKELDKMKRNTSRY